MSAFGGSSSLLQAMASQFASANNSLSNMNDVSLTNPQTNDTLAYNSGAGVWRNQPLAIANANDVAITTPSNNQVLTYNSTNANWANQNLPSGISTLSGLTDVVVATPANGDVLTYNTSLTKWDNAQPATIALASCGDVAITTPANNNFLQYNSSTSKWTNTSLTIDSTLSSLSDTNITEGSSINQNFLYWNNTDSKWEAKTLQTTDIPSLAESKITNLTSDLASKVSSINTITPTSGDVSIGLSNLSDTSITTPTNNQFLQYNSSTSKWVNTSVTIDTTLSSLSDTNIAEGSSIDQNFLYWNNTDSKWEAKALQTTDIPSLAESKITNLTTDLGNKVSSINSITPTSGNVVIGISNLSDATITSVSNNQVLQYSATDSKWENKTLSLTTALNGLTDVSVTEGSSIDQNFLYWNNTDSK